MDFELSDDQVALRDELRRLVTERADADTRRAAMHQSGAVDRDLWRTLAETGVFSLCLAEADGGVGLGLADATIVFEELGRALVPGPLVATFLAAGRVEGAATGESVVGMVEPVAPVFVEHLEGLDVLVVVDAEGLRALRPAEVDAMVQPRPLDPLTPVSLAVGGLPAGGDACGDEREADRWRLVGSLLIAAQQVGLGAGAVALGTSYATQRRQFGRVIGSFQAVKHLLSDAHCGVEVARAAVQAAGVRLQEGVDAEEAARLVAGARVLASRAAQQAGANGVQVHGGMGFTWELDAHLFLKRSMVLDTALGSVEGCTEALVAGL